jgi:hypothetical protein
MSQSLSRARLLTLLGGDEELHRLLCESGFVPREERELSAEHLELARVTRTLISELEVNWAGVEIVLRMRAELLDTRRQVDELLRLLHAQRR